MHDDLTRPLGPSGWRGLGDGQTGYAAQSYCYDAREQLVRQISWFHFWLQSLRRPGIRKRGKVTIAARTVCHALVKTLSNVTVSLRHHVPRSAKFEPVDGSPRPAALGKTQALFVAWRSPFHSPTWLSVIFSSRISISSLG